MSSIDMRTDVWGQIGGAEGQVHSPALPLPSMAGQPVYSIIPPVVPETKPVILRIAGILRESIVDGPGIRLTVFTQGCKHRCPGCHNPQTHDFAGGEQVEADTILRQIKRNPLLDGITLSGGEPFEQAEACSELARAVHGLKLNVMTYSGYTFEELLAGMPERPGWKALLEETDILVDGRFELARKSLMLKFRGSENQRILDVKKTLREGKAILANI
jgi:anaerobic ribonucleoside-triphosphate reductase activating protein